MAHTTTPQAHTSNNHKSHRKSHLKNPRNFPIRPWDQIPQKHHQKTDSHTFS